eukprot:s2986_g3.t1
MDWATILLLVIIFTCFPLLRWAVPLRCAAEGQNEPVTSIGRLETCAICLEDVKPEDPCRQLPCCCVAHSHCLLEKEKAVLPKKGILEFPCRKCHQQIAFCPELETAHCDFMVTPGNLESEWL